MSEEKKYGRYSLQKKLATGGMAEVWLARQKGLEDFEKLCVIKRILPHLADDAEFVNMFLNEARIAARFTHPNIAQIFDLGKEEGTYYIAMEYIHGEDLGRIMRQAWEAGTWIPLPIALRIIAQSCEGLHYAHAKTDERGVPMKVVHRDVSPQNVIVAFEGNAKIVDFGIARAADQVSTTRSGAIKGKFAYMSPEQASGKPLDARSDQFSIGLVLYELLTGVRPLKRDSDILTLKAAVDCQIPPPSQVAEVPPDLDAVVLRALARVADDRYPDARGFQLAIESFIVQRGWTVTSAHVSEFMRELFSDRLAKEEQTGEPAVHSAESQVNAPSGAFPLPKKVPTRSELLAVKGDGPPSLDLDALSKTGPMTGAGGAVEAQKPAWGSSVQPVRRRTNAGDPQQVLPSGARRATGPARPTAPAETADETRPRAEPPPPEPPPPEPPPPRRRTTGVRRKEPEAVVQVPITQSEPAAAPAPRTSTGERRRKSVLNIANADVRAKERERAEAVRPKPVDLWADDAPTTAERELKREHKPEERDQPSFPRWPLWVLLVALVIGLGLAPPVRRKVAELLAAASPPEEQLDRATALFLESNVPVDVYEGAKKLGTTPLENAMVPEGDLSLRLVNPLLGIERTIKLTAKGSTLRHKESFVLGRVRFKADNDCDVYIQGSKVARANGPPADFFEGSWDAECRNEPLALSGKTRVTINKDRNHVAEGAFKLVPMTADEKPPEGAQ